MPPDIFSMRSDSMTLAQQMYPSVTTFEMWLVHERHNERTQSYHGMYPVLFQILGRSHVFPAIFMIPDVLMQY